MSPIYIVSKNRADKCKTATALDLMGVPFKVIVEREQFDDYAHTIGAHRLLVLPDRYLKYYDTCDDLGDTKGKGAGAARNCALDHARDSGAAWHWVMDDNIYDFHRLHKNTRIAVRSPVCFTEVEKFVQRYDNVPLAGLNYHTFCKPTAAAPPFVANTRIYSCLLIHNAIGLRWRGRYNEDTDLSLRVLKRGDCTLQFNIFLQEKITTQRMQGGNTAEFYAGEGTKPKSQMLADLHPDVASVVWKFNRWHHYVDYKPFKGNALRYRDDFYLGDEPPAPELELVEVPFKRRNETPDYWNR